MDKKFDPQFKEFMTGAKVQGINTKKCSFTSCYSIFYAQKRIQIEKSLDYGRKVVSFNKRGQHDPHIHLASMPCVDK